MISENYKSFSSCFFAWPRKAVARFGLEGYLCGATLQRGKTAARSSKHSSAFYFPATIDDGEDLLHRRRTNRQGDKSPSKYLLPREGKCPLSTFYVATSTRRKRCGDSDARYVEERGSFQWELASQGQLRIDVAKRLLTGKIRMIQAWRLAPTRCGKDADTDTCP